MPTPWTPLLTASTRKIACAGGSPLLVSSVAWNDRMGCGCLSSRRVKSCCCKPGTGFPDLSVTTTSIEMRRPVPRDWAAFSDGGVTAAGEAFCCAKAEKEKKQQKRPNRILPRTRMLTSPSTSQYQLKSNNVHRSAQAIMLKGVSSREKLLRVGLCG